jgi:hypothetical protein
MRRKRLFNHALLAVVVAVRCMAATCHGQEPLFPGELVEFGPASRDPLFSGGGPEAWDRDLRERGWIMREGGTWHLWYTGSNPAAGHAQGPIRRLGYASSDDGLNWTRSEANPLLGATWVEDMCVVKQGGCYRMFAEGEQDIAHLLTSTDRVHWNTRGPLDIRLASGRPIPDGPRGTPAVWLEGGVWHLFYERMDRGVWLATSRDLKTFTNVSDEPVLACGPEAYDIQKIAVDQIVQYGGRYYAYYHACALEKGGEWSGRSRASRAVECHARARRLAAPSLHDPPRCSRAVFGRSGRGSVTLRRLPARVAGSCASRTAHGPIGRRAAVPPACRRRSGSPPRPARASW